MAAKKPQVTRLDNVTASKLEKNVARKSDAAISKKKKDARDVSGLEGILDADMKAEKASRRAADAELSSRKIPNDKWTGPTEKDFPIPTAKGGASRGMRNAAGGKGNMSDEDRYMSHVLELTKAPSHRVEAVKSKMWGHVLGNTSQGTQARGLPTGAPTPCTGTGCRNTIPFEKDQDYCAGDSCATTSLSAPSVSRPRG
jgi:hypothetical protein